MMSNYLECSGKQLGSNYTLREYRIKQRSAYLNVSTSSISFNTCFTSTDG
jgi:hypothetical protein